MTAYAERPQDIPVMERIIRSYKQAIMSHEGVATTAASLLEDVNLLDSRVSNYQRDIIDEGLKLVIEQRKENARVLRECIMDMEARIERSR